MGAGQIGPQAKLGVPFLLLMLDHSPECSLDAIRALGEIGPAAADAIRALERIAESTEEEQRLEANIAIGKLRLGELQQS